MRHVVLTALVLAPFVAFALSACREAPSPPEPIRPVKTVVVTFDAGEAAAPLAGQVAAHTEITAAFRIAGKIDERFVSAGDAVKKGQKLARLDDAVQRDALLAAEADVTAAEATLSQSKKQAERTARLVRQRAVSQNEQEVAERQFRAAKAQLEAARARLHSAEEQLRYTALTAEADGLVTQRLMERGEVAAAGQPVFRIAGDDGRDALFDLPEALLGAVAVGDAMRVCLDSRRDLCSQAKVYEIAPEADRATGTWRLKARIEHPENMPLAAALIGRPEKTAGAAGASGEAQTQKFRLPAAALFNMDERPAVWILEPAGAGRFTARPRAVTVGGYTRDSVIITGGLTPGEKVAAAGAQTLRAGQEVREQGREAGHAEP